MVHYKTTLLLLVGALASAAVMPQRRWDDVSYTTAALEASDESTNAESTDIETVPTAGPATVFLTKTVHDATTIIRNVTASPPPQPSLTNIESKSTSSSTPIASPPRNDTDLDRVIGRRYFFGRTAYVDCRGDWPSESGRFEPPLGHTIDMFEPLWWVMGKKPDYYMSKFHANASDAPPPGIPPLRSPTQGDTSIPAGGFQINGATCCRPTWDCFIHLVWFDMALKGRDGMSFEYEAQHSLALEKSKCCWAHYEMSCDFPQTFKAWDGSYHFIAPPACSERSLIAGGIRI